MSLLSEFIYTQTKTDAQWDAWLNTWSSRGLKALVADPDLNGHPCKLLAAAILAARKQTADNLKASYDAFLKARKKDAKAAQPPKTPRRPKF